ncbi:hypothetical protein H0H81_000410, partial [Sphagnurus paluster]
TDDDVDTLKELIKLKYPTTLRNVDVCNLLLWKCLFPVDENLRETLNTVRFDANEAPLATLPNLLRDRQQFNADLPETAPSTLGQHTNFSNLQENDAQKIVWSRPPHADATIPVTLYHPIFRQFIDDCKTHEPIDEDNKLVREITLAMSKFFPNKKARTAELLEILKDNGIPATTATIYSKGHSFPTDGAVESKNSLIMIIEGELEIGSTGAEPYAQAILYYAHSAGKKSEEHVNFNFPCLIITVFGQTLPPSLVA